ncbi:MAG: carbon-nitrogen hydrolase family protein [Cyclobacteriaceae bacterium]|nr:carbon-nitrogen hydrolase family protein [Cyclobacteriaceae bacterium HetDA_MAG_MS6]
MRKINIAIVQWAPEHLDLDKSIEKGLTAIEKASQAGADLVVFGETWFSGYPAWLDYSPKAALWDHPPMKSVFSRMMQNALQADSKEMARLQQHAKALKVNLVLGATEYAPKISRGTLFNSIFFIDQKGVIQNHHRKLVPTYTEKMLYGHGDGHGLNAVDFDGVSVTGLVCWEHWMPLSRQALHDQGEEIHVALWPKVHEMHQVASRQYAFEGRCFVLAAGQMLRVSDFPEELDAPVSLKPKDWVLNGGSCVIGPDGKYLIEPVFDEEKIVFAELDITRIQEESMTLDVTGHYQRPDVFDLQVNRKRKGSD